MTHNIAGLYSFSDQTDEQAFNFALRRLFEPTCPDGFDDSDAWLSTDMHFGFACCRASVQTAQLAPCQPIISSSGRSVLLMSGEIFNLHQARVELVQALENRGSEALSSLNGSFAFAWYDTINRDLILACDHAGFKPLYYAFAPNNKGLVFASQYNQLLRSPWGLPGELREDVLHLYMRLHHIPPPYGLLQNTYQLKPGHCLLVRADGKIEEHTWWQLPRTPNPDLQDDEAVSLAGLAIENAVMRQAATPSLGVLLSGGVDSPLVAAMARKYCSPGLKAYSIGNPGWSQDESAAAERFAAALELDFRLHNITNEEITGLVEKAWQAQHEPFADFSILPSLLVSRFARDEVSVVLSGDGGDELFFGYERPLSLLRNGSDFRLPWALRYPLYAAGRLGLIPHRSEVIAARSPADYYFNVNCRVSEATLKRLAPGLTDHPRDFSLYDFGKYQGLEDLSHYSRLVEFYGQLQRGLKKVYMASTYNDLEVRSPLLDREVIDASLRIDPFTSMKNGQRKQVLFKLLARYVPQEIIPQVKRGFAVPLGEWLRGPLRPIVEDMLLSRNLYPTGVFESKAVDAFWQEHLSGMKDHKWGLWTLMSLQGWARTHL